MLLTAPAGNDIPFDPVLCEQGRNFSNKIWNALRLVKGWEIEPELPQSENNALGISWFETRINKTLTDIEDNFKKYRISDSLMFVYKLIWDDFCSWYLEIVKPAYQKPIDKITYEKTINFFSRLMQILHPFMPFITEEVWHQLDSREEGDDIIISQQPEIQAFDEKLIEGFERAEQIIVGVRNIRKDKNIPLKERMELLVKDGELSKCIFYPVIAKLGNLSKIEVVSEKPDNSLIFNVGAQEFYIPVSSGIDIESEISKLEEELNYTKGFLQSVMKKLSNERFVNNAPDAVVAKERDKQADAEARVKILEEQLKNLKS